MSPGHRPGASMHSPVCGVNRFLDVEAEVDEDEEEEEEEEEYGGQPSDYVIWRSY